MTSSPGAGRAIPYCDRLHESGFSAVVQVDGNVWSAGFELDHAEHGRRLQSGVGAIVDRRLLHALWELPGGIPIADRDLREVDRATLRRHGDGVVLQREGFVVRTFRPATVVRTASVLVARAAIGLRRMRFIPPIFERVVASTGDPSASDIDDAARLGIGLVSVDHSAEILLVAPRPAEAGAPAVYRWWIAELAYASWLNTTAPTGSAAPSAR